MPDRNPELEGLLAAPMWHRGMYGSPFDVYSRSQVLKIIDVLRSEHPRVAQVSSLASTIRLQDLLASPVWRRGLHGNQQDAYTREQVDAVMDQVLAERVPLVSSE